MPGNEPLGVPKVILWVASQSEIEIGDQRFGGA
jgi:hypothetical protein